jgi:MoxR-like ATPase
MTIQQELETLIRARYPILYVLSSEEIRVRAAVSGIADRWQKSVYEWTCSNGLIAAGTSVQVAKHRTSPSRDPMVALDQVIDHIEPAIFVFHDLHPFLGPGHHAVIRKLKDIALQLKHSYKTILLVSPILQIPVELEKEVTVLNFPLPTREELGELMDRLVEDVKAFPQVRIELDAAGRERLLQSALGLTLGEAENVLARIIVQDERLGADHVHEVFSEKQQIIRKSGLLEYYPAHETFADVGGLGVLKDWLAKRALASSDQARAFGLPAPKGILLLGVQGCGKSLCAKAVASQWQFPLLRFDMGRMFSGLVGSSEENVRRAIAVAESVAPAVLWVDEIEKAFSGSQSSGFSDGGTTSRVLGTFLTWLSEKTAPVFVVATANDISQLPPELMRKGRLDEIFFVDLPDAAEREEILRVHLARRGRDPWAFDLRVLADAGDGFSGAELEQAIISAMFDAFHAQRDLATDDILQTLRQSVPLARTMSEPIARLRAWAEGRARRAGGHPDPQAIG